MIRIIFRKIWNWRRVKNFQQSPELMRHLLQLTYRCRLEAIPTKRTEMSGCFILCDSLTACNSCHKVWNHWLRHWRMKTFHSFVSIFPVDPIRCSKNSPKKVFFIQLSGQLPKDWWTVAIDWKNTLYGTVDITPDQYNEAVSIFDAFACKNLGDNHDLYLQTDVFSGSWHYFWKI